MIKPSNERVSGEGQTTREESIKRPGPGPLPARVTKTDTGIGLQDLRGRIHAKAKAEPSWRFWGLYTHVCKMDVLREAYEMTKKNNGAPGIDGVTFEAIEEAGVEGFLGRIREELVSGTYRPMRNRRKEIPKGNGKVRVLGIPTIRDRVVQGALKLILEPIFEADFQDGSYGYRPGRKPQDAIERVAKAILEVKTKVVDVDLKSYFDNVRHHIILEKVARRVDDARVMHLLKMMLKASGKRGVPQGGVISPLIANLYLNEVDRTLEGLKEETRTGRYTHMEYARFADDSAPRSCTRDEGRPLGAGLQEQAPNHLKLHGSRARVVSVEGKGMATTVSDEVQGDEEDEPLWRCRKRTDDAKTGGLSLPQDKPRGNLSTAWVASGIKVA